MHLLINIVPACQKRLPHQNGSIIPQHWWWWKCVWPRKSCGVCLRWHLAHTSWLTWPWRALLSELLFHFLPTYLSLCVVSSCGYLAFELPLSSAISSLIFSVDHSSATNVSSLIYFSSFFSLESCAISALDHSWAFSDFPLIKYQDLPSGYSGREWEFRPARR